MLVMNVCQPSGVSCSSSWLDSWPAAATSAVLTQSRRRRKWPRQEWLRQSAAVGSSSPSDCWSCVWEPADCRPGTLTCPCLPSSVSCCFWERKKACFLCTILYSTVHTEFLYWPLDSVPLNENYKSLPTLIFKCVGRCFPTIFSSKRLKWH